MLAPDCKGLRVLEKFLSVEDPPVNPMPHEVVDPQGPLEVAGTVRNKSGGRHEPPGFQKIPVSIAVDEIEQFTERYFPKVGMAEVQGAEGEPEKLVPPFGPACQFFPSSSGSSWGSILSVRTTEAAKAPIASPTTAV